MTTPAPAKLIRVACLAATLAILASLLVRPALGSAARAMGPLPACRYDDVLTTPRTYADWSTTLVDTILRVPKGYVPPDLVSTSEAGITGGGKVRAVTIDDLRAVTLAAAAAGNGVGVESAYRSYESQQSVFDSWVKQLGYARAVQVSARPGHSEHQLGVAIDFRSEPGGPPFTGTWATTPTGKWMNENAWKYGFVLSYPKDTIALTCYDYESWHFRYVGRDLAAMIHASGLTQREYLWANFTTTIVPPPLLPTGAPSRTTAPTKAPTPAPTASTVPSPNPSAEAMPSPSATAAPPDRPIPTAVPTPATTGTTPPGDGQLIDGQAPDLAGFLVLGLATALVAGVALAGPRLVSRQRRT
ncbi:MAG: D-alanyl-D-alanine carboxypeptidase family protein [Chloroflexi bacterium]|nr:D-alanyl-D-alanine carboxypeptidase family protein [Chloroflexota bacterium]